MKYSNYITIMILFLASATYGQPGKKAGAVYYFVDATCENCVLARDVAPGNYWLVTNKVFLTGKLNTDSILVSFKQQVKKQYPFLTGNYVKTTVIRWQESIADITTSLDHKRKKMSGKAFKELEVE